MRASEFVVENASVGATSSGSVATVPVAMGMQTRSGGSMFAGKYTNDSTPNTPAWMKQLKKRKK